MVPGIRHVPSQPRPERAPPRGRRGERRSRTRGAIMRRSGHVRCLAPALVPRGRPRASRVVGYRTARSSSPRSVHHLDVLVEQVLEHDPVDARRLVLAQPLGRLLDGADDRRPCPARCRSAPRRRRQAVAGPRRRSSPPRRPSSPRSAAARGRPARTPRRPRAPAPGLVGCDGDGVVLVGVVHRDRDAAWLGRAADDDRRPRLLHRLGPCRALRAPVLVIVASWRSSSSIRSPSGGKGKPYGACSASYQPAPIPSSTRPPEMWSTVTTLFASTGAGRKVTGETSVPRRSPLGARRERGERRPGVERACAPATHDPEVVVGAEEPLEARAPRHASASASQCSQDTPSWPSIIRQTRSGRRLRDITFGSRRPRRSLHSVA